MYTGRPQIAISRVFDAPRSLVYRAFWGSPEKMDTVSLIADLRAS